MNGRCFVVGLGSVGRPDAVVRVEMAEVNGLVVQFDHFKNFRVLLDIFESVRSSNWIEVFIKKLIEQQFVCFSLTSDGIPIVLKYRTKSLLQGTRVGSV